MTLTNQELRWAHRGIYNAGQTLAHAGLRLQGTKYEAEYSKMYDALTRLNHMLIKDINKK